MYVASTRCVPFSSKLCTRELGFSLDTITHGSSSLCSSQACDLILIFLRHCIFLCWYIGVSDKDQTEFCKRKMIKDDAIYFNGSVLERNWLRKSERTRGYNSKSNNVLNRAEISPLNLTLIRPGLVYIRMCIIFVGPNSRKVKNGVFVRGVTFVGRYFLEMF